MLQAETSGPCVHTGWYLGHLGSGNFYTLNTGFLSLSSGRVVKLPLMCASTQNFC